MVEKLGMHCIVSGKVQGVWFRASTQEEARKLGLRGWVRNLPEGQVEVLAYGSPASLEQLHRWLHQGPKMAVVKEVRHEGVAWEEHLDFIIK